jgi:phosphonate transport system substrate-binding protein
MRDACKLTRTWLAAALTYLFFGIAVNGAAMGEQDTVSRLRFGVAVGTDTSIRDRIEPFRLALERALDVPVDLFLLDTLGDVVEALTNGDIDYAPLSASAYGAAYARCKCVEPLVTARPDAFPGRYHALIVGLKTDRPRTLADLAEGRLGVQAADSVSGFLVPLSGLLARGVDPATHFANIIRVKDPVDGLQAVLDGRVDATTGWSTLTGRADTGYTGGTLNEFYQSGAPGFDRFQVLWKSEPIPYDAHTVRQGLPDTFKKELRMVLVELKGQAPDAYFAIEPDLPGGFEPVVHDDFAAVLRIFELQTGRLLERLQP